jgi:hypothetical protein
VLNKPRVGTPPAREYKQINREYLAWRSEHFLILLAFRAEQTAIRSHPLALRHSIWVPAALWVPAAKFLVEKRTFKNMARSDPSNDPSPKPSIAK